MGNDVIPFPHPCILRSCLDRRILPYFDQKSPRCTHDFPKTNKSPVPGLLICRVIFRASIPYVSSITNPVGVHNKVWSNPKYERGGKSNVPQIWGCSILCRMFFFFVKFQWSWKMDAGLQLESWDIVVALWEDTTTAQRCICVNSVCCFPREPRRSKWGKFPKWAGICKLYLW